MTNRTRKKPKAQPRPARAPERLKVRIGQGKVRAVDLVGLDAQGWAVLRQQCGDQPVTMSVGDLADWPAELRLQWLSLVRDLGQRCTVRIGAKSPRRPFEALVGSLTKTDDLAAHGVQVAVVVEAAAVLHPGAAEQAAACIAARLKEVGAARIDPRTLTRRIREATGTRAEAASIAQRHAEDFLAALRAEVGVGPGQWVLTYYLGEFYRWTGRCWRPVPDLEFAADVMRFLQGRGVAGLTAKLRNDVIAHLQGLALLRDPGVPLPFLIVSEDPLAVERPNRIVFENGVLDVDAALRDLDLDEEPELLPHTPTWFNLVELPYAYDPQANCPLWIETIEQVLRRRSKTDRRIEVLQEFSGYCLTTDCRDEKMLALLGPGGNGKSTLAKTLWALLGRGNVSEVSLEAIGNEFRLWDLRGKLANFSGELTFMSKVNEGLVKQNVSGEPVTANRKHKDPVSLLPHAKLIVSTNELPHVQDSTEAMWDRLLIVPFLERFRGEAGEDKQRAARLQAELPGIFNWALMGLDRLRRQGGFSDCTECARAVRKHRIESCSVLEFLGECCVTDETWCSFSRPLYEQYKAFCEATGRRPYGASMFGKRMRAAGYPSRRGRPSDDPLRRMVYPDLRLNDSAKREYLPRGLPYEYRDGKDGYRLAPPDQPQATAGQQAQPQAVPSGSSGRRQGKTAAP